MFLSAHINDTSFMQYVSSNLHTAVSKFSYEGTLLTRLCARMDLEDAVISFPKITDALLVPSKTRLPQLFLINRTLVYAAIYCPNAIYVIGPNRFSEPVYLKNQITEIPLKNDFQNIFACEFHFYLRDILFIHNLFSETILQAHELTLLNCIPESLEITLQKDFSRLLFENRENEKKHNPYDQELREFSAIENGDTEQLEKSWEEDYTGEIGTLASDKIRNFKNIGIVIVTLASRASIRGGLQPEIAFSLSDVYIQKIEETNNIPALRYLLREAEYQYTQMVRELKKSPFSDSLHRPNPAEKKEVLPHIPARPTEQVFENPHIIHCKDYIFSHLHAKITVGEIAKALGLSSNYLSELFRRLEGVPLAGYILNEKIKLAKNLLTYSAYSYSEIAAYLSFSSQSHLGNSFKKATGLTLRQYRCRYQDQKYYGPHPSRTLS